MRVALGSIPSIERRNRWDGSNAGSGRTLGTLRERQQKKKKILLRSWYPEIGVF
jgi:hypothetical protein